MSGLADMLVAMVQRIQRLEHQVAGQIRPATVAAVDTAKQRVRVWLDEPGADAMKSPWISYAQFAAPGKGLKAHTPPTVGQSVTLIAPTGELRQAAVLPLTWSDHARSPGTADHPVVTFGDWAIEAKGDEIVVTTPKLKIISGGTVIAIEDGKITLTGNLVQVTGAALKHNGKSVGDSHLHAGVMPGGGTTAGPV